MIDRSMSTRRVLNEEFCQKLVHTASLAVGRDVLVTDEQGIILANSDRTRIGEVHEASLEVMRKQEKIYHGNYEAGRLNATLPGVTMPLLVDGVTVGSIGIIRRAGLKPEDTGEAGGSAAGRGLPSGDGR